MMRLLLLALASLAATAGAASTAAAADRDPEHWPATPNRSCHANSPSARIINIESATKAQCAAACAENKACRCYDMTADDKGTKSLGGCRGTTRGILRKSADCTAYTNSTAPPSPPRPAPPQSAPPRAAFTVHPILGDNAVLQRAPDRAAIYGWAQTTGATITVHFRGKSYAGTVAANDSSLGALMWRVELPPTPTSHRPSRTSPSPVWVRRRRSPTCSSATCEASLPVTASFPWVFLRDCLRLHCSRMCGGQSNMGVPLDETFEWFHPEVCFAQVSLHFAQILQTLLHFITIFLSQQVANDTDYPIRVMAFPHIAGLNASTIHVGIIGPENGIFAGNDGFYTENDGFHTKNDGLFFSFYTGNAAGGQQ